MGKSSTNGVSKSSRYLLQSYYVTSAKNAYLVEKTTLFLHVSTLHIITSVVNSYTSLSYFKGSNRANRARNRLKEGRREKLIKKKKNRITKTKLLTDCQA